MKYKELRALIDADKATPADVDAYLVTRNRETEAQVEAALLATLPENPLVRGQTRIARALASQAPSLKS